MTKKQIEVPRSRSSFSLERYNQKQQAERAIATQRQVEIFERKFKEAYDKPSTRDTLLSLVQDLEQQQENKEQKLFLNNFVAALLGLFIIVAARAAEAPEMVMHSLGAAYIVALIIISVYYIHSDSQLEKEKFSLLNEFSDLHFFDDLKTPVQLIKYPKGWNDTEQIDTVLDNIYSAAINVLETLRDTEGAQVGRDGELQTVILSRDTDDEDFPMDIETLLGHQDQQNLNI